MPRIARLILILFVLAAPLMSACRQKPQPLVVHRDRIVVSNLTREPWTDVQLSLNGYYRATASELAPGGQLDAPLSRFQTGFGHFFDTKRERVRDVKVTAKTGGGAPIELTWSTEPAKPSTR